MEIERKFTIKTMPQNLNNYPQLAITQAYLCTDPVMRIRRQNEEYIFTYKGKGLMMREEYNLPLHKEAFESLLPKAEGIVIEKTRYQIPLTDCYETKHTLSDKEKNLFVELDVFHNPAGLIMAEVEFPDEETALTFTPPPWFDQDVTNNPTYHNSNMSKH